MVKRNDWLYIGRNLAAFSIRKNGNDISQNGNDVQQAPNKLNQAKVCHCEPTEKLFPGMSQ